MEHAGRGGGGGIVTPFQAKHNLQSGGRAMTLSGSMPTIALPERMPSGIAEFDRALGGGFVEPVRRR
jgi:DNA repair protein RadA/Sms